MLARRLPRPERHRQWEELMFNNLIESSSHRGEIKRRSSFFLFTTAAYALLFVIAGVASIYAYDARLDDQNTEIVTLLTPADFPALGPQPVNLNADGPRNGNPKQRITERQVAMAPVDLPQVPPTNISSSPNPILPVPNGVHTFITGRDVDGGRASAGRRAVRARGVGSREGWPGILRRPCGLIGPGVGGLGQGGGPIVPEIEPPPVAPVRKPTVKQSDRILNSEAISLPKPPYPPIAKLTRTQGLVRVQVLIDETGKVISAKAISGNPLLTPDAVRAAYLARFSPTMLGEQAVKVSGLITYNFVLQQ